MNVYSTNISNYIRLSKISINFICSIRAQNPSNIKYKHKALHGRYFNRKASYMTKGITKNFLVQLKKQENLIPQDSVYEKKKKKIEFNFKSVGCMTCKVNYWLTHCINFKNIFVLNLFKLIK